MLLAVADRIDALLERVGRAAAWLVLAVTLLMAGTVAARYLFAQGSQLAQDAIVWMHAAAFMLGLGYTLARDEHVRVDLLSRGWSARRRAAAELLGFLLLLAPFCLLLGVSSLGYAAAAWRVLESSREAGGLPGLYLVKTLIPVSALLLLLAGLARALRAIAVLRGLLPEVPRSHAAHPPDAVLDAPPREGPR
jgi:TRAP-type mannitol/chloroaromatic compound transport system permease small subunit